MNNVKCITGLPFTVKEFIDITTTLPSKPNPETPRTKEQIKRIAVHHSAVEGATIESYARYHVYTNGWPCIGYHMVIKGDQVYQTNDLATFSYHVSGQNFDSVSVSISGDLSKRSLSEAERNNLYAVILTYMDMFNIPVEAVLGHNEFQGQNTTCPAIDMNKVRSDITAIKEKLAYTKSEEYAKATAYNIGNQILYLVNMLNGKMSDGTESSDGQKAWSKAMLLELAPFMKERGLL
jgi:hypothetical protein